MATTSDQVWELLGQLIEAQKVTERQIQEVNRQIGKLGNRLGEFVECQVRPVAIKLFQERGIEVHELATNLSIKKPEGSIEIDILAVNTTEAVLIEVKSKLSQVDVDEHLERLAKFKQLMPRYADVRALGAVAAMVVPDDVARYAYRKGLFVLAQSGQSMVILNDAKFQPKAF
ncbi:hypothetical protein [Synechococcus sp. PCC 6312]|uniref:hypothetical protein n=1 Tax=Synechococcus sp. (strain ATCC 27167 / PCC 6312) TaxID=195253 RepID=UPI00029EEE87|nr:hypothetical protein [Synechococcus sp. PCC 6312]AFY62053.1 hypothetical protein Syn6312_2996 [Synechococcus sp. PCC 6312]